MQMCTNESRWLSIRTLLLAFTRRKCARNIDVKFQPQTKKLHLQANEKYLKRFTSDCINIKFCRLIALFNGTTSDSFEANVKKSFQTDIQTLRQWHIVRLECGISLWPLFGSFYHKFGCEKIQPNEPIETEMSPSNHQVIMQIVFALRLSIMR